MSAPPQVKKSPAPSHSHGSLDDLDALLGGFPSPSKPQTHSQTSNDLDDLLSDFAPKPNYGGGSNNYGGGSNNYGGGSNNYGGGSHNYGGPSKGLDDIDALLSDIGSVSRPSHNSQNKSFDDIDSLLADIGGPKNTRSQPTESIDDLLDSFGPPPTRSNNSGFSAIDDILKGL